MIDVASGGSSADNPFAHSPQLKKINDIIASVPEQTIRDILEVQDNVKSGCTRPDTWGSYVELDS